LNTPSAVWTQRYEALRIQALEGRGMGWGLALASDRGLAAWMQAWPPDVPPVTGCAGPAVAAGTVPDPLRGQIALVMADMILTCRKEAQA